MDPGCFSQPKTSCLVGPFWEGEKPLSNFRWLYCHLWAFKIVEMSFEILSRSENNCLVIIFVGCLDALAGRKCSKEQVFVDGFLVSEKCGERHVQR